VRVIHGVSFCVLEILVWCTAALNPAVQSDSTLTENGGAGVFLNDPVQTLPFFAEASLAISRNVIVVTAAASSSNKY
jgi:hypothetical protein